jgi:hypothetical protein
MDLFFEKIKKIFSYFLRLFIHCHHHHHHTELLAILFYTYDGVVVHTEKSRGGGGGGWELTLIAFNDDDVLK